MKGKFLPDTPSEGYNQVGNESHRPKTADKFCGPTKGNKDLPPERTSGVSGGNGGGQHKAGGSNAGRKGYSGF